MAANTLTGHHQALVLACSRLALTDKTLQPFRADEWSHLWAGVSTRGVTDASELIGLDTPALGKLGVGRADALRLTALLGRGVALALEVERLASRGIWIATRDSTAGYPRLWRQRLGQKAPVVVCGAGDDTRLNAQSVTIVGSRDIDEEGSFFASAVGARVAEVGWTVVSGGARGADRAAVDAAIEAGGDAIEVIAEGFEKALRDVTRRQRIETGRLTAVTAFHPSQAFSVDVVMARNKLLYTLGRVAFVAASDEGRGGTWAGAVENLRAGWVAVFVRDGDEVPAGNRALAARGAIPITVKALPKGRDLLKWLGERAAWEVKSGAAVVGEARASWAESSGETVAAERLEPSVGADGGRDAFTVLWPHLDAFCREARTEPEIKSAFALETGQLRAWLKRAVAENRLRKVKVKRRLAYQSDRTMFD